MNKDKYFSQLESLLQNISQEDRKELLYDLHEYFETGLEAGKTEEEIIEELGHPETIAKEMFADDSADPNVNGFKSDKYNKYSYPLDMDSFKDIFDHSFHSAQKFKDKLNEKLKKFPFESYAEVNSTTIDVLREETVSNKNIKGIHIHTTISNIDMVVSEQDEIHIVLDGKISESIKEYLLFDVQSQGDTITVEVSLDSHNIRNINANLNLQVSIPKNYNYEKAHLTSITGKTTIDGLLTNVLLLESTSGNVHVKNSIAEQIDMHVVSGNIYLSDSTAKQTNIKVTSGNIKMDNVSSEHYNFSNVSGDIHVIDDTLIGNMKATTTSGDVKVDIEETIPSVNINFGSITGEAKLNIDELTYETKKEHKIIAKKEEGLYEIQVNTTTGDFTLFNTQASKAN
ncbi:DUF4097 family beta strand repeat-containing protein [Longirhabdus pacifica]|uniref:DUF4097 family beta strand repeat-containing protein n=1 Tax=Longirhabdus pacifica TaxID=2305227 RepID=UPI0010086B05|nr:DUF4097 family beta strand repeat-containing protein [Longirhabdus pacifica]